MAAEVRSGRVAELTIALSLATDLGTGQPMAHGLRTCWLSLAVAEWLGLDDATRSCVYYAALLRFLGCTSDASEVAALAGGDDVAFNAAMAPILMAQPGEAMRHFVRHLAEDQSVRRRAGRIARALSDPGFHGRSSSGHCEVAARLSGRLGLDPSVGAALAHAFERWDGTGHPDGLGGEEVPVAVRIVAVARDAELFERRLGWSTAVDVLSHRRGHGYDPAMVDVLVAEGEHWLADIGDDPCARVLDAEPAPVVTMNADELDTALRAVSDFADLKSPWFRGHSIGVADLVGAAAEAAGLSFDEVVTVKRAALLHDIGQVGIASGIWDRRGPLSAEQWERVRLHPYLSERVLRRCALLVPFADLAADHHERIDGSGYHRRATTDQLSVASRLLAIADTYHAMTEHRPHRPALSGPDAASQLLAEVAAGRFGTFEVDAVLDAAGHARHRPAASHPAGLTEREVEVLRLIARGYSNKQTAAELGIATKTVGRHVEHIYAKAEVATRAGATLFAMEHDLLSR